MQHYVPSVAIQTPGYHLFRPRTLRRLKATPEQLLEQPEHLRQPLLNHLLHLIVLVVLPTVLLSTMTLSLAPMLLSTMLLSPMLSRVSTSAVLPTSILRCMRLRRIICRSTLQINIHPTLICLRLVLQSQLPTHLLHSRLNLLHMVNAMVTLSHNHMKMRLPLPPCNFYPFLEHIFGFFDEETVQVDRVGCDAVAGVVGAEYVVARLLVVLVHLRGMLFSFLAQVVCASSIAGRISLVSAVKAG